MNSIEVSNYHFHIYYDAATIENAKELGSLAAEKFSLGIGRFWEKPVGPHPKWSCQLTVPTELFGDVFQWMILNRNGLTLFCHPTTGDDLRDHEELPFWLGDPVELKLDMFKK